MNFGSVSDYLFVLRSTNSESYSRRFMLWLLEKNPDLHKKMSAELAKLRKASLSQLREGESLEPWLRD